MITEKKKSKIKENGIELVFNSLDVATYQYLRDSVGWRHLTDNQAEKALGSALLTVCAYKDGQPVGMGRLIGDGAVVCYIQDLVVKKEVQLCGIGSMVIDELIQYAESLREPDTTMMLCLMCAKGREPFYLKHNFTARPTPDLGPGMIMYLREDTGC